MEVLPCEPFQVSPKVINDLFSKLIYLLLHFAIFCYIQGMSKVTICAETALNSNDHNFFGHESDISVVCMWDRQKLSKLVICVVSEA